MHASPYNVLSYILQTEILDIVFQLICIIHFLNVRLAGIFNFLIVINYCTRHNFKLGYEVELPLVKDPSYHPLFPSLDLILPLLSLWFWMYEVCSSRSILFFNWSICTSSLISIKQSERKASVFGYAFQTPEASYTRISSLKYHNEFVS